MIISIPTFGGMIPALDKHLIEAKNSQYVENAFMYSGALRGIAAPSRINEADFLGTTRYAFRIPLNATDPTYLFDSVWLEFENADTDVITAPTAGDTFERFYWTSPSEVVPRYNTKDRIAAGLHDYILGVPQPEQTTVAVSGGSSSTLVSRAYVSTWVTAFGEEGPASDPFLVEKAKQDATFAVTVGGVAFQDLAPDGLRRAITLIRTYRTIVTAQGTASYYLIDERDALTTSQTFNDNMSDAVLADNVLLSSTSWTGPPHLDGWALMPNGIIVGYNGKDLWFCEPYRPHSWPAAYSMTLAYEVVGIATIGQTAVVATKGNPYTASGVNSFSITTSMLASFEPCISKGSIVPTEEGVYYISPNGLILVNAGRAENVTKQFITRDKWNEFMPVSQMNAARFGSAYYALSGGVDRVFQINTLDPLYDAFQRDKETAPHIAEGAFQTDRSKTASKGFLIDPTNVAMGFVVLRAEGMVYSLQNDYYSSELIAVMEKAAWWHDRRPGFKTIEYTWKSKAFQSPMPVNFAAMKVYFVESDTNAIKPIGEQQFSRLNFETGVYNTVHFNPLIMYGVVRVFADEKEIYSAELRKSGQLFRLPSGYKAEYWEVQIDGMNKINNIQMATSVKELRNA